MSSEDVFDFRLIEKFKLACDREEVRRGDLEWLCEKGNLRHMREIRLRDPSLLTQEHWIDCDAHPYRPYDWSFREHHRGGQLRWDPTKVTLFLAKCQKSGERLTGDELYSAVHGKPVLNACVLDYLLDYPPLIPEEWKGKRVFFWGTIYQNSSSYETRSHCRGLYWDGDKWCGCGGWIGPSSGGYYNWGVDCYAAMLVS